MSILCTVNRICLTMTLDYLLYSPADGPLYQDSNAMKLSFNIIAISIKMIITEDKHGIVTHLKS